MRSGLLALAIGLALADSSVVTLALPDLLARVRRRGHDGGVGADLVQPRARAHRRSGRLRRPAAARAGVRNRHRRLRGGLARLWARTVVRRPARRALHPGGGRGAHRHGRARPPLRDDRQRRPSRTPGSPRASSARRSARPRAASSREALGWESIFLVQVPLALVPLCCRCGAVTATPLPRAGRAAAPERERRPAPPLRRARGGALPARAPARRGLAACRPRRRGSSSP